VSGTDRLRIEAIDGNRVACVAGPHGLERRMDGALSGPAMFWAIDLAGFTAVNVLVGPTPATALANSSISFLEPAEPGAVRRRRGDQARQPIGGRGRPGQRPP
jgi:acyl-coenzyme A thioesterase PaaI-like protein